VRNIELDRGAQLPLHLDTAGRAQDALRSDDGPALLVANNASEVFTGTWGS
jgi:hypothetical protein